MRSLIIRARDSWISAAGLRISRAASCAAWVSPSAAFGRTGLRILRALRFASVLGFTIEPETAAAIHRCAELLRYLAAERVLSELTKLLCGQNAGAVLREFSDVLAVPIPGAAADVRLCAAQPAP